MSGFLELVKLNKTYATKNGPAVIVEDFDLEIQKRRVHLLDRSLGLRQVHGSLDGRGTQ